MLLERIADYQFYTAHEVTFQPKYIDLYESKPNFIKSFGVKTLPALESANINSNRSRNLSSVTQMPPPRANV